MAFNPSPKVNHVREFAKKFGCDVAVVLYITKDGQLGYASYGETKALCAFGKQVADAAYEGAERMISRKESASSYLSRLQKISRGEL